MLDADHFKRINDSFGHAGGDATLQALTRTMGSLIRSTDLLGRLGGEEFSILMPATSQEDAARLAERLREAIAALTLRHGGREIQITASIGVAGAAAGEADLTRLLREADQALYAAKEAGRNRVAAASAALDYA
jgi:diguanylate cyclase (GGDEF)-like protein